jgi:hypothetical protein
MSLERAASTSRRTRSTGSGASFCHSSCRPCSPELFAFTLSLDEFIIRLFLIGAQNTLPIYIHPGEVRDHPR